VPSVTQAARDLFGNVMPGAPPPTAWPLWHAGLYTVLRGVVLPVVFIPLTVRQYQRAASR
jgi:ABC-2 type transport system permease protein